MALITSFELSTAANTLRQLIRDGHYSLGKKNEKIFCLFFDLNKKILEESIKGQLGKKIILIN
ncbi:hypothetical protein BpHYR1_015361 [Brachionus plicatilis]|uniref:Uncharacterized protein n=1 Tax=Brachionus plicatilis TaxID=10195 RepID=A0A3M7T5F0_BRAPC|nr:hypothetical protein BpHYR1_015361 [Brachionus plicatilis]